MYFPYWFNTLYHQSLFHWVPQLCCLKLQIQSPRVDSNHVFNNLLKYTHTGGQHTEVTSLAEETAADNLHMR